MKNVHLLIILPALFCATTAFGERTFRWVDNEGLIHYGNRVPPEFAKQERKEINDQGRTIKIYEALKTPEQLAEAKRLASLEAEKERQIAKQAIHDRSLLATYANEQDMLLARDGKIAAIDALLQLTSSRIESMKQRLLGLTEEAATYERSGKQLPLSLEDQINNLRRQLSRNERFIKEKTVEMADLSRQFDADIKHYIELTAEREGSKPASQRLAQLNAAKMKSKLTNQDKELLSSYSNENDILEAKELKLASLEELLTLTNSRIESMQIHLSQLSNSAKEYRNTGKKVPEVLSGQMKNVQENIDQSKELRALKAKEKLVIEHRYNNDIKRYRELTADQTGFLTVGQNTGDQGGGQYQGH